MKITFRHLIPAILLTLALNGAQAVAGAKLDDATVFAIFDQANTADIWAGRLGFKNGNSAEVRALGKMVATDHETVQQLGRDLAKKLGIIPTPPADDTAAEKLAETIAMLQSASGVEFDRAYLHHEILFHQAVISAINTTLLPAVKNEEFQQLIKKVLPGFEHHLAATKAAAEKLGMQHRE